VKKNETTSNNFPPSKIATEEEAKNFKLETHLISAMIAEPFYTSVLRCVNYIKTDMIPTAGVLAKDGDINMWWNPRFLASLTSSQVRGLLKHEAMHLVYEHTTSRRMDPHIIHNYATDLAINSEIPLDELPKGGLIPGVRFDDLDEDQMSNMTSEEIDRYNKISKKIESLPKSKSSEWYFSNLMEDKDLVKDIQKTQEHQGKSLSDALRDGDISINEEGKLVDKDGNPITLVPGSMDDHDGWDETSAADKDLIKGKLRKALEDAIKECDNRNQWGSVPASLRKKLRLLVANDVDWRSVLKRFVGLSRRGTRSTSWTRLNKKYAGRVPGVKRGYTSSIAVYIDQSGSVGPSDLELAFGNLKTLSKKTEFTTFHFDCEVDTDSELTWSRGRTPEVHRTRAGGTDFECVTKHANENKHRFDGYIIITDGEASKPSPSRIRRGWLIVPNRKLLFDADSSDFVMNMKPSKEKRGL
jgi:predicted metal-dependent peptidase